MHDADGNHRDLEEEPQAIRRGQVAVLQSPRLQTKDQMGAVYWRTGVVQVGMIRGTTVGINHWGGLKTTDSRHLAGDVSGVV